MRRLFLFLFTSFFSICLSFSAKVACLNTSLADLYKLAGGDVCITVKDALEKKIADEDAVLVDSGSGMNINSEILIKAEPDLVLLSSDTKAHINLIPLLSALDIPYIVIRQDSFSDFMSVFKCLTEITGRPDLYEEYAVKQKNEIEKIKEKARAEEENPRVLFIRAGSGFSSVRAKRAEDHFAAGIIEDIKAVNVADEYGLLTDHLSAEAMLKADIDKIIIVAQGDEEASYKYIEELFGTNPWKSIKAVKENSVYFLSKELFHYKPNARWSEAYSMMYKVLYDEKQI